jgi:hypothetical protein
MRTTPLKAAPEAAVPLSVALELELLPPPPPPQPEMASATTAERMLNNVRIVIAIAPGKVELLMAQDYDRFGTSYAMRISGPWTERGLIGVVPPRLIFLKPSSRTPT